jgi:hypothetical protein
LLLGGGGVGTRESCDDVRSCAELKFGKAERELRSQHPTPTLPCKQGRECNAASIKMEA